LYFLNKFYDRLLKMLLIISLSSKFIRITTKAKSSTESHLDTTMNYWIPYPLNAMLHCLNWYFHCFSLEEKLFRHPMLHPTSSVKSNNHFFLWVVSYKKCKMVDIIDFFEFIRPFGIINVTYRRIKDITLIQINKSLKLGIKIL
jgi:hypothetical protein